MSGERFQHGIDQRGCDAGGGEPAHGNTGGAEDGEGGGTSGEAALTRGGGTGKRKAMEDGSEAREKHQRVRAALHATSPSNSSSSPADDENAAYFRARVPALESLFASLTEDLVTAQPANHEAFLLNALAARCKQPSASPVALRASIQALYGTLRELHAALGATLLAETERQTSRQDYLLTLSDLIGPPPARDWRDEWQRLSMAIPQAAEESAPATADAAKREAAHHRRYSQVCKLELSRMAELKAEQIRKMVEFGWEPDEAVTFAVLSAASQPLAQALKENSQRYAASTYTICRQLYARAGAQEALPPMLYCHLLNGPGALAIEDKGWFGILKPDAHGFQGITSKALVTATDIANNFAPSGFAIRVHHSGLRIFYDVNSPEPYRPIDSPVVGFESAPADHYGAHAAVMTAAHSGSFPPNTLFKVKRKIPKDVGFVHERTGVRVMQELLVVSATFCQPAVDEADAAEMTAGRFSTPTLQYVSRAAYIRNLTDVCEAPTLTMAQEFDRDFAWTDWLGSEYTLRAEFEYCAGVASRLEACTAGVRDAANGGCTPHDFRARVNEHIRARRQLGLGINLDEDHAFLTLDETLAVRLYSGPAFQPINVFLRQIASLTGKHRAAVLRHAELTFSATVSHICSAIRKLAAVNTEEVTRASLYRGVRGELPRGFWVQDEHGAVTATDTAFMSTSRNSQTPIDYLSAGTVNVLWVLHPDVESDSAYHCGADITLLAQFAHEEEILFPPFTMMTVLTPAGRMRTHACPDALARQPSAPSQRSSAGDGGEDRLADGGGEESPRRRVRSLTAAQLCESLSEMCTDSSNPAKSYMRIQVLPSFV